jgi:hypothetical protein
MSHPDLGMTYEDVSKRLKRIQRTEKAGKVKNYLGMSRLTESLRNQLKEREGEGAVKEVNKELIMSRYGFSGKYPRSGGIGKGKKGHCPGWAEIDIGHYRKVYG